MVTIKKIQVAPPCDYLLLADKLCGYSCETVMEAIINYLDRPDCSEYVSPLFAAALDLHKSAHKVMPFTTLNSGPDVCSVNLGFKTYDEAFEFYRLLLKLFSAEKPESVEPPFLYRISDGERFIRNQDGFYCMENSMMHDPYVYPYKVLMATGGFSEEKG